MTILFMGGEMGAFVPSGSEAESTSNTRYDAAFSRCATEADGSAVDPDLVYVETAHWTAETEGYLHFYLVGNNSVVTHDVVTFYDNADTQIFRLRTTPISGGYTFTLQYLNAVAAWVTAGTFDTTASFIHYDIYWNIDASGGMSMWAGGTKRIELLATDLSHLSGVEYVRLHGWGVGGYYSQVVVTDDAEPTIGGRLLTVPVTGAGSSSDWTGTFASIDEVTYSDADFIFATTNGNVSLFAHATTIPTGYVLRAIGVTARAKRGVGGPQNFQLAIRASSSNAFSSTIALDVGYTANCVVWETNPTTAVAWVNGDFAGLQVGAKAIT